MGGTGGSAGGEGREPFVPDLDGRSDSSSGCGCDADSRMAGVRKTKLKRRRWFTFEAPGFPPMRVGYFDADAGRLKIHQSADCPVKVRFEK